MGVSLSVKFDVDRIFDDIQDYVDTAQQVAVPRALNKALSQAQTAGLRAINDEYRIPQSKMRPYLALKLANSGDLEATITASGKGFPLILFDARKVAHGVSVSIKGRRVIIPHAFIATVSSGGASHTGVFARGAYGGKSAKFHASGQVFGRFAFSTSRLAINELYTLSPPDAFANADVVRAMDERVAEALPGLLAHEISFATGQ